MTDKNKTSSDNVTPLRPPVPCPECGKQSSRSTYPFCSSGCRSMDLNRWLSGRYVLPGKPINDENEN
ncbi:DNA gyrase inhibitor YacG [Bartonella sp. HY329]|uniref:DNA gyrase inhibitor YacG n=1 Tax=unclassified Bartonella TaxID=2645622 RepID=UPI0021C94201|nr:MULTISPECIES: DNA gyrase inhibitor YacG [unclassified Bartonella]UXM95585.1 DNA gyrase inhibitor YacG [Bartonella sp. HY329]UXN09910.1 DNA gyrase inhibitor YacG [Bartonella sp. HY328]